MLQAAVARADRPATRTRPGPSFCDRIPMIPSIHRLVLCLTIRVDRHKSSSTVELREANCTHFTHPSPTCESSSPGPLVVVSRMIMLALVLQPFTICFLVSPSNNHDDVRAIGPEEEPPVLCPPRLVVACTSSDRTRSSSSSWPASQSLKEHRTSVLERGMEDTVFLLANRLDSCAHGTVSLFHETCNEERENQPTNHAQRSKGGNGGN